MTSWDHVSLPARAPSTLELVPPSEWGEPEPASPLGGWVAERTLLFSRLGGSSASSSTVQHSGWLLKAYDGGVTGGPARQWRRRFVWLTADRLCYTADPEAEGARYLPLDRIPVRALPRGYGPKLGVTLIEDRQVDRSGPQFSPKKAGCVFSVACGSHTHFFAASSPAEAKAWVEAITTAWLRCVKHTSRGAHTPSAEEALAVKEAHWRAESAALRRSLAEAEQQRLRESTAQWQAQAAALAQPVEQPVVCYEIEVLTGSQPDAGTTASVYVELCGAAGSSGEHRLMYREGSGRTAFCPGATDTFRLHCRELGPLHKVRVFHNNAGGAPEWFLESVRVRRQGGDGRWTGFPCSRWLAVNEDDGRVMRELVSSAANEVALKAPLPPPMPATQQQSQQPQEAPAPAQRVQQPVWYTVAVCTSEEEGAGLVPADSSAKVFLTLHGARGSSQRVQLPAQAGDFERGQEDVFRVQLPGVGSLEKLTIGLSGAGEQAAWLVEQVEVTDEASGEMVFFPCNAWLGRAKGAAERSLVGSRSNPREARLEAARLRQQVEAANRQLAAANAELAAARAAAAEALQAGGASQDALATKLAALQAEVQQLQAALAAAHQRAAAAEARVEALQGELQAAQERAAGLQKERETIQQAAAADSARSAELAAQLAALQDELALAQEAAAAAAAKAKRFEGEAWRGEEQLQELRAQHERLQRDNAARAGDSEGELARLRAEVAAKAAELRDATHAEAEAEAECERLGRELAAERLRAKERLEAASTLTQPEAAASAKLLASYRVCIHTSAEPPSAGTTRAVCLELLGSSGSTGTIRLDAAAAAGCTGTCFAAGSSDVFQLEAPAVGELRQLNIWVDVEGAGPRAAAWHLDTVEVVCKAGGPTAQPVYFVCRRWLDERCGHRAELATSMRNPHQQEVDYKLVVYTSSLPGCGCTGNVFVDLQGDKGESGVLTLRNKGGSFRPGQADEFSFRLPGLGALTQLRVGHDGRKDWHLERLEVVDSGSGTTHYFPCDKWVKSSGGGSAMSRCLRLQGYTTDPASLPVQYRAELAVEGASGVLGPDSLRVTLFGPRGETEVLRLDASRAAAGRMLACTFEAANVGQLERLRIGLAPADERTGQHCGLLLSRITVTNMVTGESAAFFCSEWMRSSDPYDFELDAEADGAQEEVVCRYRLEVQTSDVRKAGTSGSVYVTLTGDICTIGPYQLRNTEAEYFQRGQLDVFEVEGAPDCGRLQQIEVRHDGAGRGNGWHLAWVKATNLTTGAVALFKCERWVDRRRQEDPGIVAVVVALPPDQAAAASGRRSTKDRLLLGSLPGLGAKGGIAASAALQAPAPQEVQAQAELGGSMHRAEAGGMEGLGAAAALPGYRVVFHTSRMCGSGTRAKVHFELTGSRGSSGVLHPVGTSKSFGSGRMDVFEYPSLPFLGELQSARVGTDGSGFFPAWHLRLVVVTHIPTGRVWQFSCFSWIDKKSNFSRWLQLDSVEERAIFAGGSINIGGGIGGTAGKLVASGGSPTSWQGLQQRVPQQGLIHASSGTFQGSPGTYYRPSGGSPRASTLRPKHSPLAAGLHGSPTAGQGRQWDMAGSPTAGQGRQWDIAGSPTAGQGRQWDIAGSPTAGQGRQWDIAGSPTAGQGRQWDIAGSPTAGQGRQWDIAGSPTAGQGRQWDIAGSPTAGQGRQWDIAGSPTAGQGRQWDIAGSPTAGQGRQWDIAGSPTAGQGRQWDIAGSPTAGQGRQWDIAGSPTAGQGRQWDIAGSPTAGQGRQWDIAGSPTAGQGRQWDIAGSPTAGQGRQWDIAGSPSSPTVLRSGSGMPGSPLIGARRPGSGL
ncbi:lipoxygenase homology domain-containing 1 isoform A [Chlorella sorokiniana]|uniref:Lipoxygenase homology domain-containing 1 isoform A n=1 Tax=Chlorella sorokiniana TaxID=3076 RepID=A0A2P6U073_CHLSO|nr:lipoxygenase homology domain-containing 1 isoform A [Chlorella sorokiniana]|eukprot:PRW59715.1 lipoxygenase homology domain-containing 1 isoform A [Chlorella sorokiniana]